MPEDSHTDDVEKFLSEQKMLENRKQALIAELLKQKEAAIRSFDDQLAKLGYVPNAERPKRSHHRKSSQGTTDSASTADKRKPKH